MNLKRQKVDSQRIEKTDVLIRESFSDFVRLERRNLLAIAAASLFAVLSGATVQADVTIFGLKFSGLSTNYIFLLLFSICLYFFVMFWIASAQDFHDIKKKRKENSKNTVVETNPIDWILLIQNKLDGLRYHSWLFLMYIFPLLLGVIAMALVLIKIYCSTV